MLFRFHFYTDENEGEDHEPPTAVANPSRRGDGHIRPHLSAAFATITRGKIQALRVLEVPVPLLNLDRIGALALRLHLPVILPSGYPNSSGLISCGTSIFGAVRDAPVYVD